MKQNCLLLFTAIILSGCSNKLFESNWKTPEKESSSFRFYDADSKIRYNLENDSSNLYFSFDVMDQLTIQKIITTGLRVFVDGTAKNKQKNEVQFPIYSDKVPVSELQEYGSQYDQSMQLGKQTLDQMIPTDGYLKIDGKTTALFNRVEAKGVQVVLEFDETRSLVYRLKVPLKLINPEGNVLSVGIETGGYELPSQGVDPSNSVVNPNQLTAGDRAMGRGIDGVGMGGMGGAPGLQSPGQSTAAGQALRTSTTFNEFAEPIRFWVKVKLKSEN
jgi:hypothetical protein